jgi:hypothetical protein
MAGFVGCQWQGDLDGGGDLDIIVGAVLGGKIEVWFNDLTH